VKDPPRLRGYGPQWQGGRRELEKDIREDAVKYQEKAREAGLDRRETAGTLLLSPGTLKSWVKANPGADHEWIARGRKTHPSALEKREEVFQALKDQGRETGVVRLQGQFAIMPRREVVDLKRLWLEANPEIIHILKWTMVGSVWGVDHANPPYGLQGPCEALWAVRDLASHNELVWTPVLDKTARGVRYRLEHRFEKYGAPLAVKMDNGALAEDEWLTRLFERYGVVRLLSPAYTPEYNGAIEASIRWMKVRTGHQAELRGSPEVWSREDCEAARRLSNETSRPWGASRPTAQEAWDSRTSISPELRELFLSTLSEQRLIAYAEIAAIENPLDRRVQAKIERQAVTCTLVVCGLLIIRRRLIPTQLNPPFWPEIP